MSALLMMRDAFLAALLFSGIVAVVIKKRKLTLAQFGVLFIGLALTFVAVLVDLVWRTEYLLVGSMAALSIIVECLFLVTPSDDWPKLYIRFLQIGFGLLSLSICSIAIWHVSHPFGDSTPHKAALIVGLGGTVILSIAFGVLRPRGRPWGLF